MADEPTTGGWLPPRAPGGEPAPRFEPAPPEEPGPEAAPAPPADRPVYFQAPTQPGNGAATTALVLGILGMFIVVITAGAGFLFSLPASIGAWIAGKQGRKRVARGETQAGDGLAHAGVMLGIVGVVLAVVGMVVWVALVLSGLDLEELRRDLEERSNPDADQAFALAVAANLRRTSRRDKASP
jgi:hypothetical protein